MGKIWLRSPDPNKQCCGCEGKTGPCSYCCLITGDFAPTIKDVYLGNLYGYGTGEIACLFPSIIVNFNTPTGQSFPAGPSGKITRSYTKAYNDPTNVNQQYYPTTFDIFEGKEQVCVKSRTAELNDLGSFFIRASYTLSSSASQGMKFDSSSLVYDYYSSVCGEEVSKHDQFSSIDRINLSVKSGDNFYFYGKGYLIRECYNDLVEWNQGGKFIAIRQGCAQQGFLINVFGTTTTTGAGPFVSYLDKIYSGDSFYVYNVANTYPSTVTYTPVTDAQANAFCANNYHPPAGKPGGCGVGVINIGCYATIKGGACCVDGGVNVKNPNYYTNEGSVSFTFLRDSCVEMGFTDYFSSIIKIKDRFGTDIDPISRTFSLTINTGSYRQCNALP